MPKRSMYLHPPNEPCQRTQHDLEFLCNYWNRLRSSDLNYDVRLSELLRANHLMRQLSSLPTNYGLRVNVNLTILGDNNRLEPENICSERYQLCNTLPSYAELNNSRSFRSSCNGMVSNNLFGDYIRQINENNAALERELIRARVLAPFIERNRNRGCQNAFCQQRAATNNCNKFRVGNRPSARVTSRFQEKCIKSWEKNDHRMCAPQRHECCIANNNRDITKASMNQQKDNTSDRLSNLPNKNNQYNSQDAQQSSPFGITFKDLQSNNKVLPNCEISLDLKNNTVKRDTKESMEACQNISKSIDEMKTFCTMESPRADCQENVEQSGIGTVTDSQNVADQGRSIKRKMKNCLENEKKIDEFDQVNQDRTKTIGRIKPGGVRDVPAIFSLGENSSKTPSSRTRNARLMEGKPRKHASSSKYASFLRMCRKEDLHERFRGRVSDRKSEGEKPQYRNSLRMKSTAYENGLIHDGSQIERRTPIPRSTVHTAYNSTMHSPNLDSTLDASDLAIQLLRLAVLLYAPTLLPTLNSLIAHQDRQMPVSVTSFEGSNDLLTQIFRLLNDQQSIPNLPFVLIPEKVPSILTANTNIESSSEHTKKEEGNVTPTEKPSSSKQESSSIKTNNWILDSSVQNNGKDKKWRMTSILDSDARLDKNIFKLDDFQKFLKNENNRENILSLSTRNKNEIVTREYFRDWLNQVLHQLETQNTTTNHSFADNSEAENFKKSSKITSSSSLIEIKDQQDANRTVVGELPNFSKSHGDILTERDEVSDDQKSFISATSTNSSTSV